MCREIQLRIQVTVRPENICSDPIELQSVVGCDSENVRCETLEDGALRQTRIIPASSVRRFEYARFGVISTVDNQQVDYSIHVKVYR